MTASGDKISLGTATSITIANMVGTGVFTSLGFQLAGIGQGFSLLLLWTVGGVLALCGALTYGELAAALPRSGGEYNFISRSIHPSVGFLCGWVSLTLGFGPPIALAAIAFGEYFGQVVDIPTTALACGVVGVVTLFHLWNLQIGSAFQNVFTVFKVLLILAFMAVPFFTDKRSEIGFLPQDGWVDEVLSAPFGVSLLFVMFAYTGWNAATYIVGEVRDPQRTVPQALFLGTAGVMLLYVAVHWAFLVTTPADAIRGQVEVGWAVATHVFGAEAGRWVALLLSVALVSTISAMTWAGPRVTQTMGEDYAVFSALGRTNARGIPVYAILLQTAIVFTMILTATFDKILVYVQFILTASSALAVLGVFVLRARSPELPRPYKTLGYPVTPAIFLVLSVITMIWVFVDRPWESLAGLLTVLAGVPFYLWSPRLDNEDVLNS